MAPPVIELRDVTKRFRLRNRSDSLRDAIPRLAARLLRGVRSEVKTFTALDGVSFTASAGEVLGIIGANGAGKSTSLKLVAGLYDPDAGTVSVSGRVSALIELQAGFHPDLSGRENIFLAGALLGLRRREMVALLDDIVEFADIGQFIDSPVRMYSSGMAVRLGFSVAAHVPAAALVVDEALAVGDIDFQARCLRKMGQARERGAAILFVSHNLTVVEQFCSRVVFLRRGKVEAVGPPHEIVERYRRTMAAESKLGTLLASGVDLARRGTGEVTLEDVRLTGDGGTDGCAERGQGLEIRARWEAKGSVPPPVFGISIVTREGTLCGECQRRLGSGDGPFPPSGRFSVRLDALRLLPGEYDVSVYLLESRGSVEYDRHSRLYPLRVLGPRPEGELGAVELSPRLTIGPAGEAP